MMTCHREFKFAKIHLFLFPFMVMMISIRGNGLMFPTLAGSVFKGCKSSGMVYSAQLYKLTFSTIDSAEFVTPPP
jgi:hypothetical protein